MYKLDSIQNILKSLVTTPPNFTPLSTALLYLTSKPSQSWTKKDEKFLKALTNTDVPCAPEYDDDSDSDSACDSGDEEDDDDNKPTLSGDKLIHFLSYCTVETPFMPGSSSSTPVQLLGMVIKLNRFTCQKVSLDGGNAIHCVFIAGMDILEEQFANLSNEDGNIDGGSLSDDPTPRMHASLKLILNSNCIAVNAALNPPVTAPSDPNDEGDDESMEEYPPAFPAQAYDERWSLVTFGVVYAAMYARKMIVLKGAKSTTSTIEAKKSGNESENANANASESGVKNPLDLLKLLIEHGADKTLVTNVDCGFVAGHYAVSFEGLFCELERVSGSSSGGRSMSKYTSLFMNDDNDNENGIDLDVTLKILIAPLHKKDGDNDKDQRDCLEDIIKRAITITIANVPPLPRTTSYNDVINTIFTPHAKHCSLLPCVSLIYNTHTHTHDDINSKSVLDIMCKDLDVHRVESLIKILLAIEIERDNDNSDGRKYKSGNELNKLEWIDDAIIIDSVIAIFSKSSLYRIVTTNISHFTSTSSTHTSGTTSGTTSNTQNDDDDDVTNRVNRLITTLIKLTNTNIKTVACKFIEKGLKVRNLVFRDDDFNCTLIVFLDVVHAMISSSKINIHDDEGDDERDLKLTNITTNLIQTNNPLIPVLQWYKAEAITTLLQLLHKFYHDNFQCNVITMELLDVCRLESNYHAGVFIFGFIVGEGELSSDKDDKDVLGIESTVLRFLCESAIETCDFNVLSTTLEMIIDSKPGISSTDVTNPVESQEKWLGKLINRVIDKRTLMGRTRDTSSLLKVIGLICTCELSIVINFDEISGYGPLHYLKIAEDENEDGGGDGDKCEEWVKGRKEVKNVIERLYDRNGIDRDIKCAVVFGGWGAVSGRIVI